MKPVVWIVSGLMAVLLGNALRKLWSDPRESSLDLLRKTLFVTSPDGAYRASARNFERKVDGETKPYYQFMIIQMPSGDEVESTTVQAEGDVILFRDGDGGIFWESDSTAVRFGTPEIVLWEYSLVENKTGEQDGGGQPATRSESK